MTSGSAQDVTRLLIAWQDGDRDALDRLTSHIHAELHRLAHHYMAQERADHTLQTTALVNEAYIRLIDWKNVQWQNRAHFFGVAAQLMRRVLVDFARSRNFAKRGGQATKVFLDDDAIVSKERTADLNAIDDALTALAKLHPRQSRVVELKFFGGLNIEEIAEVLNVSTGTVRRDWSLAKAWIYREITGTNKHDA